MADRESLVRKRRGAKLLCIVLGKGVIEAIDKYKDLDFAAYKFNEYSEALSKVFELCSELSTFDTVNSQKEVDVFMENFQKEINSVVYKYENFKENAAKF